MLGGGRGGKLAHFSLYPEPVTTTPSGRQEEHRLICRSQMMSCGPMVVDREVLVDKCGVFKGNWESFLFILYAYAITAAAAPECEPRASDLS